MNTEVDLNSEKMKNLMRKIRALKAKAEDPSTTEAESLAFAAKVAEMLAQHDLEEAQLDVGQQSVEEQIGHEEYVSNWNASPARRVLAIAVCHLYNVKPLIRSRKGEPWTLIGRKHNIVMVKDMTEYLIRTTLRLSKEYGRTNPEGNVIDFRRGCFKRLSERITDMYWQTAKREQPAYTPSGNPGNLPALYADEKKRLQQYVNDRWNVGTLRPQRVKQGASAIAGRAAGDRVSLNQQIGGAKQNNFMIGHKK
jgi:Protein of unknown function (DUF2786)